MCTLILGRDVIARGTVVIAANRDEDPARAADPPGILNEQPRLVGGRDRRAGGTWLAVRPPGAVVAILNRRGPDLSEPSTRRSRGTLVLEAASAGNPSDAARAGDVSALVEREVRRSLAAGSYAPFTLVFASPGDCWCVQESRGRRDRQTIGAGWHVITHADLDDRTEPRTAWLFDRLRGYRPSGWEEARTLLTGLLRSHGEAGGPPVCIHEGPMSTVSSSLVALEEGGARYLHLEGRPCEHDYADLGGLLAPAPEVLP